MDKVKKSLASIAPAAGDVARFGTYTLRDGMEMLTPRHEWLAKYSRETFMKDVTSGCIVASVLIPNAMAYSLLAGVDPIMGLYAALVGSFVGALWGSSRHVVTGPVGIVSLLTLSALAGFAAPNSSEFFTLAIALAVLAGLMQFALGFFKMGFIMRLIPHSVLTGFASAGALIIALSQMPALLGFKIPSHEHVFQTVYDTAMHIPSLHWPTALLGLATVAIVFTSKKYFKTFPIQLAMLIVAGFASYWFGFKDHGVNLVGYIPSALPHLNFHALTYESFITLLGKAFVISVVGFVETYAIARAIARKTKERIDANQELIGQGTANTLSGLFGGFPVSGSFSLSALNVSSGARTRVANMFASLVVLLTIVFLAPLMYYLPKSVLAAFVIVAVSALITVKPLWELASLSRTDSIIAITTFAFAFILKPDDAVFIGIIVALALFMRNVMWVEIMEIGLKNEDKVFYSVDRIDHLKTYRGVLIARMDMALMYANSDRMAIELSKLIARREEHGEKISTVIIHCAGISFVDATGAEGFEQMVDDLRERHIRVAIVHPRFQVRRVFETAGILKQVTYLRGTDEMLAYCESHTK